MKEERQPAPSARQDNALGPHKALMKETTGRRLLMAIFSFLVLLQLAYLAWIGNGLGKLSDGFSEANALRAAQAYLKDGLASHHGLPRQLYGNRFPGQGMVKDHIDTNGLVPLQFRQGFPPDQANPDNWVYTHYPPGPDYLCAIMGRFVGLNRLWLLRLLPLSLGLLAAAVFFRALTRSFGVDRAALIAAACLVLPMFNTYMPGLHYQGYSFALLLLQMSCLIQMLWQPGRARLWSWPLFFAFGFLQGWLSFDQFFVVCLISLPFWLMRRAEGSQPSVRWLFWACALPSAGFALAHILHFLQVAAEFGGIHPAFEEFRRTAAERTGQSNPVLPQTLQALLGRDTSQLGYFGSLALGGYYYLREVLILRGLHFGPFMFLALVAALPVVTFRTTRVAVITWRKQRRIACLLAWPGPKRALPAVGAALLVSLAWWLVMPAHVVGNSHITVRHLFVLYFFLLLTVVRSISVGEAPSADSGTVAASKP